MEKRAQNEANNSNNIIKRLAHEKNQEWMMKISLLQSLVVWWVR